jgi:hypothetical protein
MFVHIKIKDVYGEVILEPVNIFHIMHIKREDPKNAESDCVLVMRNGTSIRTCQPIYELMPLIDDTYRECVGAVLVSLVVDAQEEKPKKKKVTRKRA